MPHSTRLLPCPCPCPSGSPSPSGSILAAALTFTVALILGGCRSDVADESSSAAPRPPPPPTLRIAATSWPVAWLADRLAGDHLEWVARSVLEREPGSAPSAEEILELAGAELVLVHGLDLEGWIATAALPESRLVATTQGLAAIEVEGPTHSHGPEGEHSHRSEDPRSWTDPLLYLEQAQTVQQALASAAPEIAQHTAEASAVLRVELTALHEQLSAVLVEPGVSWASAGGVLSYLARRHRLEHRRFDIDPQGPLDDHELEHLRRWAAGEERPVVVWDSPPSEDVLAAMPEKLRHVVFDPVLAAGPDGYRYLEGMATNVERLSAVVR